MNWEKISREFDEKFYVSGSGYICVKGKAVDYVANSDDIKSFLRTKLKEGILEWDKRVFPESAGITMSQSAHDALKPIYERRAKALEELEKEN